MNYRVLFLISLLVLAVGLGGLFMMPSQTNNVESTQPATSQTVVVEKKTIKMAMANQDMPAGAILKQGDYQINELQVEEESPLIADDVTDLLAQNSESLNGFLISDKASNGRFLAKATLISPTDERFLFYTVGKDEVVYRVYIRLEHQFALDTLKSGDIVGIFAQQKDFNSDNADENRRFDKILQNLEVVKIDRFSDNKVEGEPEKPEALKDYAGYVSVRMKADKVKELLTLTKSRALVVLPEGDATYDEVINKRGLSIRSLRGR